MSPTTNTSCVSCSRQPSPKHTSYKLWPLFSVPTVLLFSMIHFRLYTLVQFLLHYYDGIMCTHEILTSLISLAAPLYWLSSRSTTLLEQSTWSTLLHVVSSCSVGCTSVIVSAFWHKYQALTSKVRCWGPEAPWGRAWPSNQKYCLVGWNSYRQGVGTWQIGLDNTWWCTFCFCPREAMWPD